MDGKSTEVPAGYEASIVRDLIQAKRDAPSRRGRGRPNAQPVPADDSLESAIIQNVHRARQERHLTQTAIAARMGIHPVQLSGTLTRKHRMSIQTLAKLAMAVGVSPADLCRDPNADEPFPDCRKFPNGKQLERGVVGAILKSIEAHQTTQASIAERAGISQQWVCDLLKLRNRLSVDSLDRIASALGDDPAHLLNEGKI